MASSALGEELVKAVYADWKSAPVGEPLRAALGVVNALTLHPQDVPTQAVAAARGLGLNDRAIGQVIHICGIFNMIVRLADALAFDVPDTGPLSGYGEAALKRGYAMD